MQENRKQNSVCISLDRADMTASVVLDNVDESARLDIILILLSRGNTVETHQETYRLPWHHLRRVILPFFTLCSTHEITIEPDSLVQEMIDRFAEDYRSFTNREPFISVKDGEIKNILTSEGFKRRLTDFQDRDVRRLLMLKHGANFSVPGAGKTTTLLAIYSVLRFRRLVNKLVVVAPINAFVSWEEEWSEIFGSKESNRVHRLSVNELDNYSELRETDAELLLVNYEKLRRHSDALLPYFMEHRVQFVLDESHRIKAGERNLSFQEIVRVADIAIRRDVLSGTPMPQGTSDLDPQFDFLWTQKVLEEPAPTDPVEQLVQANLAIEGRFTRTTKRELGLPDPIYLHTSISMGPVQTELYSLIRSETARLMSDLDFEDRSLLRGLQRSIVRLMQVATNPMLLGTGEDYEAGLMELTSGSRIAEVISEFARYEKPAKIEYLRQRIAEILLEHVDSKVVIWSYFVRNIRLIESLLKEFEPLSIYGAVPSGSEEDETKREGILKKFKTAKNARVLIANPQACGEGISLHKVCHYALYLDRSFNAAHYLQSVDRIHRVGLPAGIETRIEILSSANTIDEVINTRLIQKSTAMGAVLNDPQLLQLAYDPADIDEKDESGLDMGDIDAIAKQVGHG